MLSRHGWMVCLFIGSMGFPAVAQEAEEATPNELLVGKLIYVEPMPGNLDEWVIDFLRRWGKYKVTGDPQGVDLIWQANIPRRNMEFTRDRQGVPRPRTQNEEEQGAISMTVVDWVTGERLWHVVLSRKKRKKKDPPPLVGPRTKISTRKMNAEQLADELVRALSGYVEQLGRSQLEPRETSPPSAMGSSGES